MGYLYYRATFRQDFYALPNIIANFLQSQPLSGLFATFTFRYGEQMVSTEFWAISVFWDSSAARYGCSFPISS